MSLCTKISYYGHVTDSDRINTYIISILYALSDTHSGGIVLTFIGTNLDVVQKPMLVVNDPQYLNVANVSATTIKF